MWEDSGSHWLSYKYILMPCPSSPICHLYYHHHLSCSTKPTLLFWVVKLPQSYNLTLKNTLGILHPLLQLIIVVIPGRQWVCSTFVFSLSHFNHNDLIIFLQHLQGGLMVVLPPLEKQKTSCWEIYYHLPMNQSVNVIPTSHDFCLATPRNTQNIQIHQPMTKSYAFIPSPRKPSSTIKQSSPCTAQSTIQIQQTGHPSRLFLMQTLQSMELMGDLHLSGMLKMVKKVAGTKWWYSF